MMVIEKVEAEVDKERIIGGTGMGKTHLVATFYQQDEFGGFAKVVVDPSGMLARQCYAIIRGKAFENQNDGNGEGGGQSGQRENKEPHHQG